MPGMPGIVSLRDNGRRQFTRLFCMFTLSQMRRTRSDRQYDLPVINCLFNKRGRRDVLAMK